MTGVALSDLPSHNNPPETIASGSSIEPSANVKKVNWIARGVHWLAGAAGFFTLSGAILRVTLADSVHPLGILFYATPLPVLVAGSLFCLVAAALFRQWNRAVFWLIMATCFLPWWVASDFRFPPRGVHQTATPDPQVSVLLWNVARRSDLTDTIREIRERDADLVALIEMEGEPEQWRQTLGDELPGYDISVLGGGMFLLVRGTAGTSIPHSLGGGSEAREIAVTVNGMGFNLILVDINANLRIARDGALTHLARLADERSDKPLLVLGDFNTPPDSVWLTPLRQNHQLAFEASGRGYRATWPTPLPLMQLDQIWTNNLTNPIGCQHYPSIASDHLQVMAIIGPAQSDADPTPE